jgi:ABC-2 type transport system ATP-binding protein
MIRTADVRVDYDDVTAVQDLNLSIGAGEVFGLIGPNGAGKSSTIRVLATLQEPTYGDVFIGGLDAAEQPQRIHRILGYMPDMAPVYDDLTVWEFLDLFARAYFVDRRDRRRRIDELIEKVNLSTKRRSMGKTLSRGMKQRLVLAKTLLHDPQVLLLDEPASGLDPIGRIEMRNVLVELSRGGRTVLISSHILTELSEFCTSIGIMQKGRMLVSGPIQQIIEQLTPKRKLIVELAQPADGLAAAMAGWPNVSAAEAVNGQIEVEFDGGEADRAELLAKLVGEGVRVKAFYERRMNVESIMLNIGAREVS